MPCDILCSTVFYCYSASVSLMPPLHDCPFKDKNTCLWVPSSAWQHSGHQASIALITRNKSNLSNIWKQLIYSKGSPNPCDPWERSSSKVPLKISVGLTTLQSISKILREPKPYHPTPLFQSFNLQTCFEGNDLYSLVKRKVF